MKLLVLSRYAKLGASSRYRMYQYLPFLRSQGYEVTVAPLLSDRYVANMYSGKRAPVVDVIQSYVRRVFALLQSNRFDLIWLQREALPWIPESLESLLLKPGVSYVVDYDDAYFHRYDLNSSAMIRWTLGKKIDKIMRRASLVIAGNEYIADRARRSEASRVEIVPTVVDLARYPLVPLPESGTFTIGWIGSPVTSHYLSTIRLALKEVCRNGSSRLTLIGAGFLNLADIPVERKAWSELTEVQELQEFDVGIMPLLDTPWEQGKCGFKLIQYMACARPAIGSPVGANKEIISHGIDGFHASTIDEWIQALQILRSDKNLRENMGKMGRSKVERKYNVDVAAPRLEKMLREAARG
jgi:glycosyltransferase involved in cell wall biosynthesis